MPGVLEILVTESLSSAQNIRMLKKKTTGWKEIKEG